MKIRKTLPAIFALVAANNCLSDPTSAPVLVQSLRSYLDGSVYVQVDSNVICNTTMFKIDASFPGAKEMYSGAMAAMMAGKKIQVEINNATGCTGWGTKLQSLTVFAQ